MIYIDKTDNIRQYCYKLDNLFYSMTTKSENLERRYTLKEIANSGFLGDRNVRSLRYLIQTGRLKAANIGTEKKRMWLVSESSLKSFLNA